MRHDTPIDLWELEATFHSPEYRVICGIDEAGRGPLAGPVYAAAVILPEHLEISGLNDSKKLTEAKREALYEEITQKAVAYGIASASEAEIDEINILQATFLAMGRAVAELTLKPDFLIVDGNRLCDFGIPAQSIVKGDSLCASIAAASILAKVTRDRYMKVLAQTYPQYGFEIHKGYGTKRHYEALTQYGPCPAHRQSFLRKFYGEK